MSSKLGQEPAFPINEMGSDREISFNPGISKRFYAACAAMQSLITSSPEGFGAISRNVKTAYEYADELLKQENL